VAAPRRADGLLGVHHFPVRSAEQFARKIAYKADLLPQLMSDEQRTWVRLLAEEGEDALMARFDQEHRFADPDEAGLVLDPCP
jgi:hypothetical protein